MQSYADKLTGVKYTMNDKLKTALAIIALAIIVAAVVVWAANTFLANNTLTVGNVEAELTVTVDGAPLTNGGTIDWGTINPGNSANKPLTVKNNDNTQVTLILSPTTPAGVTLSWAMNSTILNKGDTSSGTLTVAVASGTTAGSTPFTFQITT